MKKKHKYKISYLMSFLIMIELIIVMSIFSMSNKSKLTSNIRENTINSMENIVAGITTIIENYIYEAEGHLIAYSRSSDVINLLKDPTNADLQSKAQAYTETFSADINYLEGIYASEWNTHVLTHTNAPVVGITTRSGDPLIELQQSMLAADGVYNTGIIISPASQQQIISMYLAVLDENENPIGLVGGGIFTTGLKDVLNSLPMKGMENAKYYLINTLTGEYIFHENEEMIGEVVEDENLQAAWNTYTTQGTNFYENDHGDIYMIDHMSDRGWIFVLTDTADEIFASVDDATGSLLIVSILAEVIMVLITFVTITIAMKPLSPIGSLLSRMSNCDITEDDELRKYLKRGDDLGDIANATETLLSNFRVIIDTLQKCNEKVSIKAKELHKSAENLADCVSENIATTEELSASLENVTTNAESINFEIDNIKTAIEATISSMQCSKASSEQMSQVANIMKADAEEAYRTSKMQLEEAKASANDALESLNSLTQINDMASDILSITGQTNLLALNASIEAARAGDAGKGFSVVATEIKKLAENSGQTAENIRELCKNSNDSIVAVRQCMENIISFVENDTLKKFENFAERSVSYSDSAEGIQGDIETVSGFIRDLSSSINQISQSLTSVVISTQENVKAIADIVKKNEAAAIIADEAQKHSEENEVLSEQLSVISDKFSL